MAVSIGRNKLAMLVKEMCRNGGIAGTKSNHSLCATGAAELYRAGVPEKIEQGTDMLNPYKNMNIPLLHSIRQ